MEMTEQIFNSITQDMSRVEFYEELRVLSQLSMIENEETHDEIVEGDAIPQATNCFRNSVFDSIRTISSDTKNFTSDQKTDEDKTVTKVESEEESNLW